jgi:hypothetical protein
MEDFSAVNWLAVVLGAVAAFLVGWLWYSPKMFGVKWAAGVGVQLGSASSLPVGAMVSQFAALFLLATVVGITATTNALFTALLAILAAAMFVASSGAYVKKSSAAILIEFFYIVVAGAVMILAQGAL